MKKFALLFVVLLFVSCAPKNTPEDILAPYTAKYGKPTRTSHYVGTYGYESHGYIWDFEGKYISIDIDRNPSNFKSDWYLRSEYVSEE